MRSPLLTRRPFPGRGSRLLQDLGFLAFTLPQVEILMPTKKPRGQELPREQQWPNQALHQRRLRIEHVNSSVKRCRIVKDRIRLWKEGVRDLVMELCCALHNFRVRLNPGNRWFNRDKLNLSMTGWVAQMSHSHVTSSPLIARGLKTSSPARSSHFTSRVMGPIVLHHFFTLVGVTSFP